MIETSALKYMERSLKCQLDYINMAKYYRGLEIKSDPGEMFIKEWIVNSAHDFRIRFNKSLCKECLNYYDCGHTLKDKCDKFKEG
jgi:hypothetical protein